MLHRVYLGAQTQQHGGRSEGRLPGTVATFTTDLLGPM